MMNRNKLNIFITGSTGFIGNHLKQYLKEAYTLITPSKKNLNLKNKYSLKKFLNKKKPNIIIHLASSTKFKNEKISENKNQFNNTFMITKNLIDSLNKECNFLIFFGSIEEYGKIKTPFKENCNPKPFSYYGKYKNLSLKYLQKKTIKNKINYIWVRPSLTYGQNDNKQRILAYILHSIKNNKKIYINNGNQFRDFLYIDDLCKIIDLLIKNRNKKFNSILNISSQNYIKLCTIPKIIEKILKKKINYDVKINVNSNINLLNSNKKLLTIFPNIKFTNFYKGLTKTLKKEGII